MFDTTLNTYATRAAVAVWFTAALALLLAPWTRIDARVPTSEAGGNVSGIARVIDGDTIRIGDIRIRLEGIDAPESSQTCGRSVLGDWPCGQAASQELSRLLEGHDVQCESKGLDKYGRVLGLCFADGIDVNAEMVRRGMAWAFVRYSNAYVSAEEDARSRGIGIWQGKALPAWEYRHKRWASAKATAPSDCAIKGNVTRNGRIYHMPWSPWYDQIKMDSDRGKRWFCSEAEAIVAGWRAAQSY